MADGNIEFEKIILKKHHYWRDLLIILFVALVAVGVWQYMSNSNTVAQSSQKQSTTTSTMPGTTITTAVQGLQNSLINDENYVQGKINAYLKDNPRATEDYARDVVYLDIARAEKNAAICDKIKDSEIKYFCSNAVR